MYNKKKHKKRDIIFIRKNISNGNVKNRIQSLLSDGDSKNETNNAIGVFYQLLGYGTHMLSYTSIIGLFFNIIKNPFFLIKIFTIKDLITTY